MTSVLLAWLVGAPASAQELHDAGTTIEDSVALQAGPEVLESLGQLIPEGLVPTDPIELDALSDSGGWGCANYEYALSDAWVGLEVLDVRAEPGDGVLEVVADLEVWLNDDSDPFKLYIELLCGGQNCPGVVDRFPVEARIPVALEVVDRGEGPTLAAVVGEPVIDNGLESKHINLDCSLDTLESVLDFFGLSLYELVISVAEDQLSDQLADLSLQIEQAVDEALVGVFPIEETFELQGAELALRVEPTGVGITPGGLELRLGTQFDAPPAECIAQRDPGGSNASVEPLPSIGGLSGGAGVLLSDDAVDQALYAAWRGGLLCFDLSDPSLDLGIPLDSSLLGALGGDEFGEIFEEGPLDIRTDPRVAPTTAFTDDGAIAIQLRDLGVDLYAGVDHRVARAVGLSVAADVNVDLTFDGTTGLLGIDVAVDEASLATTATGNELLPSASPILEERFTALLGTVLDGVLGPALQDLEDTQIPGFEGIGLTSLTFASDGPWLAAEGDVGPVEYSGGCDEEGGCEGGCSGGPGSVPFVTWLLAVGLWRRRRP